jgi:hypothetical protein
MDEVEFVWTFPVYILCRNAKIWAATGELVIEDSLEIIAPPISDETGANERHAAIFTDADSADGYRQQECGNDAVALPLKSKDSLMAFFAKIAPQFRYAVLNPNPKIPARRSIVISSILEDIRPASKKDPAMD